jgi:hypothetical protein
MSEGVDVGGELLEANNAEVVVAELGWPLVLLFGLGLGVCERGRRKGRE